jgi:Ankyrin repeats (3 copies)
MSRRSLRASVYPNSHILDGSGRVTTLTPSPRAIPHSFCAARTMKVSADESTPYVRRQESATRLLVRTVSSQLKGSFRKSSHDSLDSGSGGSKHQNTPSTIERFAEKGKFDEIMALLSHDDHDSVREWLLQEERCHKSTAVDKDSDSSEDSEEAATPATSMNAASRVECTTALHLILMYRPPVELVDLLCLKLTQLKGIPYPEDFCDMNGMNPLHLAVANGCDIEVVRRLLSGGASELPAWTMDAKGRLPLHWACTNVKRPGTFFITSKKELDNTVKNAYILIRAFSNAKLYRDENKQTPMDLAVEHKVDERIIAALHPSRKQILTALSGLLSDTGSCTGSYRPKIPMELDWDEAELDDDDISSIGMKPVKGITASAAEQQREEEFITFRCRQPVDGHDEIKNLEERLADCLAAFDDI